MKSTTTRRDTFNVDAILVKAIENVIAKGSL